jgi:GNAT superfamily N-acetyltransferase
MNERFVERCRKSAGALVPRKAGLGDFAEVLRLYLSKLVEEEHMTLTEPIIEAASESIRAALSNKATVVFVVDDDGEKIAGQIFCVIEAEDFEPRVRLRASAIYVDAPYRKSGAAQALLVAVSDFGKLVNATRVMFYHGPGECSSFYKHWGAELVRHEYEVKL